MARPRKEIDWKQFDKLCALQATLEEIAEWFGCSVDTIERAVKREWGIGFAEYHAKKAGRGRISLRRQQWQAARKGSVPMLIWLGKQFLGQTDKQVQEHRFTEPVKVIDFRDPAEGGGEGATG